MPKKILICTVGGSYQPIVTAINELKPDYVYFICTSKDQGTGQPGSELQIIGKGSCIKAKNTDEKPTLPNIPTQAQLTAEQFSLHTVLADDLDDIYSVCQHIITQAYQTFPNAQILADYTGGTKSMSAGLIMAVMEHEGVQLQLITGARADLIKVQDGFQSPQFANVEKVRFERLIAPYINSWQRYAYSEAEAGLKQIQAPRDAQTRGQLQRLRDLSRAYAEWDNFNHADALIILQRYAPSLTTTQQQSISLLRIMTNPNHIEKRDAALLFDLYINALRRAEQGRYDDAVARCYRLMEWSAQWLLSIRCNMNTSDILEADIPQEISIEKNRDGKYQAGLFAAWQLVKHKTKPQSAAAMFINAEEKNLKNHLQCRNHSILAHGFEPITQEQWHGFNNWLTANFIPMLLTETRVKILPPQLPKRITD